MGLNEIYRSIANDLRRNWPKISIYSGIAGFAYTAGLAVYETPEALRRIEKKKKDEKTDKLTLKQTIEAAWKCYIPPAMTGVLSATLIACGDAAHSRRNAALSTACMISESALRSFRRKTAEIVGEQKEKEIHDAVIRERIEQIPPSTEVLITGNAQVTCYDSVFGRKFMTTYDALKDAERSVNSRLFSEMYISLNEFYEELGLPPTKIGNDVGWNIENGYLELYIFTRMDDDGKTPCYAIDYNVTPDYNFSRMSG